MAVTRSSAPEVGPGSPARAWPTCRLAVIAAALLIAAWRCGAAPPAPSPTSACEPRRGEVTLFTERDFRGACVRKGPGVYRTPAAIGMPAGREIGSIQLGHDARLVLCGLGDRGQVHCRGVKRSEDWFSGLAFAPVGLARVGRGLWDRSECEGDPAAVLLITRTFHTGDEFWLCHALKAGNYPDPDALGIADLESRDDREVRSGVQRMRTEGSYLSTTNLDSVMPGNWMRAWVCAGDRYTGDCLEVDLDGVTIAHAARPRDGSVRLTRVRSMQVYRPCTVGSDSVVVHAVDGAKGSCATLGPGLHPQVVASHLGGEVVRTVRTGAAVQATACTEEHLAGRCHVLRPLQRLTDVEIRSVDVRPTGTAATAAAPSASLSATSSPTDR